MPVKANRARKTAEAGTSGSLVAGAPRDWTAGGYGGPAAMSCCLVGICYARVSVGVATSILESR